MAIDAASYEKLGAFYLGRARDADGHALDEPLLYDSQDLLTHALCVGMTGSGKTGLCLSLLEEAAIDGVPALVIDPKGDLGNLLLTFPNLAPEDFAPWIDSDRAAREGTTPEALASKEAETWKSGLAKWGQDGARIARLKEAAEFAIYTPGSEAGLSVSVLATLAAPPPEVLEEGDLLRDRIGTLASSLLGLVGIAADPVKSREHILLSSILDANWRAGKDLDLATLVGAVQKPPFERIGVLELESFYPAKERFELAMAINALLASPSFAAWLQGDPLDVDKLLYSKTGKPRIAIFSIAHLGDAERMFFVSLLLSQTLSWMRTRPGTSSLRAILYMDEIFGYFPPVAEPPSKKPLLTLLKQARAFGVGLVLATQNPIDLDYRGLANIGTWFLGRLQTDRDKQRILDGLEGAASGSGAASGFDRARFDSLLSALEKRVFLLHDVHEPAPVVFETRWAMSYLRGPLTRSEIKKLTAARVGGESVTPAKSASAARVTGDVATVAPVLPTEVTQVFLPLRAKPEGVTYEPALYGDAVVRFSDAKRGIESSEVVQLLAPLGETPPLVDFYAGEKLDLGVADLERTAMAGARFASLPSEATKAKSYSAWEKDLADCLYRTISIDLWKSPTLGEASKPQESERDFRIRLGDFARERRDQEKAKLREKYGAQAARLQERVARASEKREREAQQASQQKLQAGLSIGSAILGALFGRKKLSVSTLGRASTAMRGAGRAIAESKDVARADENLEQLQADLAVLNQQCETDLAGIDLRFDPQTEALEKIELKPKKSDVEVRFLALAWVPFRDGEKAW